MPISSYAVPINDRSTRENKRNVSGQSNVEQQKSKLQFVYGAAIFG